MYSGNPSFKVHPLLDGNLMNASNGLKPPTNSSGKVLHLWDPSGNSGK